MKVERIQYPDEFLNEENISQNISTLWGKALPILLHRKTLYDRYTRCSELDTNDVVVALEYYIATIATGYFGGKEPQYKVRKMNETQKGILTKLFKKIFGEKNIAEEFQTIIDYITKYNDNGSFFYDCVKDYVITGACYGLNYQNNDDEIVYVHTSSLTSVAIWNYEIPSQKIGLLRCWYENSNNGGIETHLELITKNYKKHYIDGKEKQSISTNNAEYEFKEKIEDKEDVLWNDAPIFAVENPDGMCLFECVIPLIKKHEQIIRNNANTFQYNDNAKLKVIGYGPENDLLVPSIKNGTPELDENNQPVMTINEERKKEEEAILNSKVFYIPDSTEGRGDVDWLIKNINDTASENHKKTCLDMALMISGVPNVTDQGFTNADNAAALEKKFFPLDQVLQQADKLFKKELLRMWEMITDRINIKMSKNYDFRDIEIILTRNLPQNNQEIVDNWLKLRGLLSDKTIIEHLPYELDSESELAEMDLQNQENIEKNLENIKKASNKNSEFEVKEDNIEDDLELSRSTDEKAEIDISKDIETNSKQTSRDI